MEYTDKFLPQMTKKILDLGLNFYFRSLSDMFVFPNATDQNSTISKLRQLEQSPQDKFILSEIEKNKIKDYDMDQLNDFIYNKFGSKFILI
jgi:hypothetical protein